MIQTINFMYSWIRTTTNILKNITHWSITKFDFLYVVVAYRKKYTAVQSPQSTSAAKEPAGEKNDTTTRDTLKIPETTA